MNQHVTKGNIFDGLNFNKAEAENLKVRAALMSVIKKYIKDHHLTQTQAAKSFKVDQARISKLLSGRIDLFTIDRLVNMLGNINLHIEFKVATCHTN